ncbi:hypothetical protein VTN77DRAFT_2384 [Rasamsonia byssochlamydoides]|uniref:uncharacterized protein n=1 Tax=Rasamsonia byssochlamydoides TaxID=89139 RepID=UPI003742C8BB
MRPSSSTLASTVASLRRLVPSAVTASRVTSARPSIALAVRNFSSTSASRFRPTSITMGVQQLNSKPEFQSTIESDRLVVLDAFATWCGPCKAIAPKVEQFSETYTDATFVKVDVDAVPDVAQELGIRAMPTFLLFKGGKKVAEVVGANPAALEAAIKNNL